MKTKRTFKALIAMALALILSLGTMTSAFAANVGEIIDWPATEEYEYTDEYIYKGELSEGTNHIKENEEVFENGCYTFEVEKAGYYLFTCDRDFNVNISEEIVDGAPFNYATALYGYKILDEERGTYENYSAVYLSEGTAYVAVYYYSNYPEGDIEISYLGEELVDIDIDEDSLQDLIMNYDFGYGSGKGFDLQRDITLVFADGSKKTVEGAYIRFVAEGDSGEAVEGENTVTTANTFGIEKQYTMTCHPMTYYIKKVEISNLDKYLKVREYYYPSDYDYFFFGSEEDEDGLQGETLTVTLNDGSTQSFELIWDNAVYVTLQNGNKARVICGEHFYDGKVYFELMIGGIIFMEKECEVIEASDIQNIERLGERIKITLDCMVGDLNFWIEVIKNPDLYPYYTTAEAMLGFVQDLFSRLGAVGGEIRDCCEHLILG